jgi:xanthine dehydrogenase accessory factor
MQYKREEVRDMNLYGEILKKLEGTPCLALERSFVGEEGNLADMRCELKEGAEASEIGKEALTQGQPVCGRAGSSWNVAEPFFPKERLIILGGGHVALPVAEFGARVGFLVTVVDDRLSFANPGRFPMAEKVICDDFGHAIKELKIQESDYICIVTRGSTRSKMVLFAYITQPGSPMIGFPSFVYASKNIAPGSTGAP